jgi:hypothetical protein
MELNAEQEALREQYVIALLKAAIPIQEGSSDREVTMELLVEAADIFKDRIRQELDELRMEDD